jgi:hypothetical protein
MKPLVSPTPVWAKATVGRRIARIAARHPPENLAAVMERSFDMR